MLRNGQIVSNHSSEKSDCLDKITSTTDSTINVEAHFKARKHHVNQPTKNTIPCPFLSRRGWCLKGENCDFLHPIPTINVETHSKAREHHVNQPTKNTVPCPFLSRRGWCLKGENCDFLHPNLERNQRNCDFLHPSLNRNQHYRPFLFPIQPNACQIIRRPKYPPYPRPLMEFPFLLPQLPPIRQENLVNRLTRPAHPWSSATDKAFHILTP